MAAGGAGVLRQLLAVFTFETDTKGLDKGKAKLNEWVGDMKKVAAAFTGGMIARGIGHFVKDTVDEMMNIRKGAQELKITTDEMQQLQSAARATGMDVKWLHFTLERLEVNVERAGHGAARQAEAMRLLGINAKNANGSVKSAKELFLDFASGMEKVKNQNTQARAVWDLMGRGAHRLLPLLRMGRQRVEELMNATEEYGKYQKEEIEQAAKYTITLEHMRLVWMSIKGFIMSQWLPVLEKQTNGIIKAGKWLLSMAKHSLLAKAALQMLQVAMAGLAVKMAVAYPWATALLAALTALTLIWDDILVMFHGGDSLIGYTIDKLFGKGQSTAMVQRLKSLYDGLAATLEGILVMLGMKPPQTETDRMDAPGGGAAAPEIGRGSVSVRQNKVSQLLGNKPVISQVPGGVEVTNRALWDRLFDPNGSKNISFGAPPLLDTQSRPDDSPNMSIGDVTVHMTQPEGTDAMSLAKPMARAFVEQVYSEMDARKNKDAAASLRREKH